MLGCCDYGHELSGSIRHRTALICRQPVGLSQLTSKELGRNFGPSFLLSVSLCIAKRCDAPNRLPAHFYCCRCESDNSDCDRTFCCITVATSLSTKVFRVVAPDLLVNSCWRSHVETSAVIYRSTQRTHPSNKTLSFNRTTCFDT